MISMIVAYEKQRGIGKGDDLLWGPYEMSSDMARFRRITRQAGTIIIGSNSLRNSQIKPGVRPFPSVDQVIVLTRRPASEINIPGVDVAHSMEEALRMAKHDVVIAGGGQTYRAGLLFADTIYATEVDMDLPHDIETRFPELSADYWQITEDTFIPSGIDETDPQKRRKDIYPSRQVTYIRRK